MNERHNRQLSAVIGAFLVLIAAGVVALLGADLLEAPVIATQATLLGLAGVFDHVAARDNPLTDYLAWYQWSGLGNVLLGLSLPLGFLDSGGSEVAFLVVTAVGGLSLAAMGVDMLVFHGKHTRGERLDG